MKTILKEIFIMCLLCVVITLVLGILFYEYMPTNDPLPSMISYKPNEKIAEQIEEIDLATKNTSIIQTYSMSGSDLSMYKAQNIYVSGKIDPFADYKDETESDTSSTQANSSDNAHSSNSGSSSNNNNSSSSNNSQNNSGGSSSSNNSSSSTSTSSGSFFEKPGVK